jgi:hypothetical protein
VRGPFRPWNFEHRKFQAPFEIPPQFFLFLLRERVLKFHRPFASIQLDSRLQVLGLFDRK